MKKKIDPNCTGFTLIELMVVIMIMGVMAMIAMPNLMAYPPKMRLRGAAQVLASDLMAARMEAVKLNRRVYLEYSNSQGYKVAYLDKTLKTKTLTDKFEDVQIASDFGKIWFNSRGISTGTTSIQLTNISGNKNISINLAGRVKIE